MLQHAREHDLEDEESRSATHHQSPHTYASQHDAIKQRFVRPEKGTWKKHYLIFAKLGDEVSEISSLGDDLGVYQKYQRWRERATGSALERRESAEIMPPENSKEHNQQHC